MLREPQPSSHAHSHTRPKPKKNVINNNRTNTQHTTKAPNLNRMIFLYSPYFCFLHFFYIRCCCCCCCCGCCIWGRAKCVYAAAVTAIFRLRSNFSSIMHKINQRITNKNAFHSVSLSRSQFWTMDKLHISYMTDIKWNGTHLKHSFFFLLIILFSCFDMRQIRFGHAHIMVVFQYEILISYHFVRFFLIPWVFQRIFVYILNFLNSIFFSLPNTNDEIKNKTSSDHDRIRSFSVSPTLTDLYHVL